MSRSTVYVYIQNGYLAIKKGKAKSYVLFGEDVESFRESLDREVTESNNRDYEFKTYVYKETRDQLNEIANIKNISISSLVEQEIRISLEEGIKGYVKKRNIRSYERKIDKTCKIVVYLNYNIYKRIENIKSRLKSKSDYLEWIVKRIIKNFHKELKKK